MTLKENPTDELLAAARKHGLDPKREGAFLMWVTNECWEGREVLDFMVLTGRARELALMFRNQDSWSDS